MNFDRHVRFGGETRGLKAELLSFQSPHLSSKTDTSVEIHEPVEIQIREFSLPSEHPVVGMIGWAEGGSSDRFSNNFVTDITVPCARATHPDEQKNANAA